MKKELVFCTPLRRQYYTQISKKNYDSYIKNGISSNKFWGDIFEDMIYRDWFYGCYVEDQSFDIGYCFSLEIDSQEVKGFQKYFTSLYKNSFKKISSEVLTDDFIVNNKKNTTIESNFYGISMEIFHDRAEMKMNISKDFDINKFSIGIEKTRAIGSNEIVELYTPFYDGKRFDEIELDDENRNDPIIFYNNKSEGLYIFEED
jgi:hypothetical protein